MALVLRRLGRVELARSFHRDIKNNNDYFHFAVGRTEPWSDDTAPERLVGVVQLMMHSRQRCQLLQQ